MSSVNWTGDWSVVPATFDTRWMAAIQGVKRTTIWTRCQKRTQSPRPMAWKAPYKFLKSSVQAQLEQGAPIRPALHSSRKDAA